MLVILHIILYLIQLVTLHLFECFGFILIITKGNFILEIVLI